MIAEYFTSGKVMTRKKKLPGLYCTEVGYHRNKGKSDDNSTNNEVLRDRSRIQDPADLAAHDAAVKT